MSTGDLPIGSGDLGRLSTDGSADERTGRVAGLFIAGSSGAAIESREAVTLVVGVGVAGDRYAEGRGYWSDPRWPDQQLTLVDAEVIEALGLAPGDLRRNVVTRGVSLEALIGKRIAIGAAIIEGIRPCDPCVHIEERNRRPGLLRDLAGRGGLRARILRGGRVAVGDGIAVLTGRATTTARSI